MRIDTYLYFDGNCAEAFEFYEQLLNGTGLSISPGEPLPAPAAESDVPNVTHAHLLVGQSFLYGADVAGTYQKPQSFRVTYEANSTEDAARVFAGLAEGGEITTPLAGTYWAHSFGMVTDRFGIPWMINLAKVRPFNPINGRTMP